MSGTLLKKPEVATRLGISESKLEKMMASRQIKFVKLGNAVRFRPEAVESFITRNEVVR